MATFCLAMADHAYWTKIQASGKLVQDPAGWQVSTEDVSQNVIFHVQTKFGSRLSFVSQWPGMYFRSMGRCDRIYSAMCSSIRKCTHGRAKMTNGSPWEQAQEHRLFSETATRPKLFECIWSHIARGLQKGFQTGFWMSVGAPLMMKFLEVLTGFLGPLGPVPQVYFTRMVRKSGPVSIRL